MTPERHRYLKSMAEQAQIHHGFRELAAGLLEALMEVESQQMVIDVLGPMIESCKATIDDLRKPMAVPPECIG